MTLLDVGCGPGTITIDLARLVAPGRVVAVDAAAGVLEAAAAAAAEAGVGSIEWRQADAAALPFDDGSFDVAHAHQLLQHVGNATAVLGEMARVCRPGGVLAARDSDYATFNWFPEDPLLTRWLAVYRDVARANGGTPDAGRRLLSWAGQAGLEPVTPSASLWCFATPDERAWWAELWAERTTATIFGDRAVELGLAGRDELESMAEAWHRWSHTPDGWFVVVHGEILVET